MQTTQEPTRTTWQVEEGSSLETGLKDGEQHRKEETAEKDSNRENTLNRTDSDESSGHRTESPIQEAKSSSLFSVPRRYILAILMFCGFMNMYAIRVNLNVAIGAMVKNHTIVQNGKHINKVSCHFAVWHIAIYALIKERIIAVMHFRHIMEMYAVRVSINIA